MSRIRSRLEWGGNLPVNVTQPLNLEMTPSEPPESDIVRRFTEGLTWDSDGVWTPTRQQSVSYPDEGNDLCAAIEETSFWFRHRNRIIAAAVERYPPPAGPIFDLGGGNGYVALGLRRAGHDTVLVEPGRSGALTAVRRGVGTVICASVETAGIRPGTLPAVGIFDVLEHIQDDLDFLRTLRTALQPGGRLYLSVPAFRWLWSNEDDFAGHFRRYTVRSLTRVLRKANFEVDYAGYFFTFLPPVIFFLRSIPTRLGLRKDVSAESWRREHASGSWLSRQVLETGLSFEVQAVRRGYRLPAGSSLLCVARTGCEQG